MNRISSLLKKAAPYMVVASLVGTLGSTRIKYDSSVPLSRNNLEAIEKAHHKFHAAITSLYHSPSIATAQTAQLGSLEAFATYFLYADNDGPSIERYLVNFCSDAKVCLKGLSRVQGQTNYITHYSSQINWRAELAKDVLSHGKYSPQVWDRIMKPLKKPAPKFNVLNKTNNASLQLKP